MFGARGVTFSLYDGFSVGGGGGGALPDFDWILIVTVDFVLLDFTLLETVFDFVLVEIGGNSSVLFVLIFCFVSIWNFVPEADISYLW